MLLPCRDWILFLRNTHSTQNLCPETFHRFCLKAFWKHLMRPGRCGDRDNTPSILIAHQTRTVIHESFACCLTCCCQTFGVNIRIEVRIRCCDRDKRSPLFGMIIIEEFLPFRKVLKAFCICLLKANMREHLVIPINGNIICSGIICLRCKHMYEVCAGDWRMNDKRLILLQVDSNANHECGILFE